MKLSESLKQLGKVVVYYPALARFFGSVNAAIFFAQLWYWQERSDHGYVWKTAAEIEEETGLSYREQHTARQVLCGLQVMVENHDRLRHEMHFTLDLDRLDALWNEHQTRHERPSERPQFGNDESAIPERRKRNSGTTKTRFPNDENAIRERRKRDSRTAETVVPERRNSRSISRDYQEITKRPPPISPLVVQLHDDFSDRNSDTRLLEAPGESAALRHLAAEASARCPEDPGFWAKKFLDTFWVLKDSEDSFWRRQPYLPSEAAKAGIFARILEEMNRMKADREASEAALERERARRKADAEYRKRVTAPEVRAKGEVELARLKESLTSRRAGNGKGEAS